MKKLYLEFTDIDSFKDSYHGDPDRAYIDGDRLTYLMEDETAPENVQMIDFIYEHSESHALFQEFLEQSKNKYPAEIYSIYKSARSIGLTLKTGDDLNTDMREDWSNYCQDNEYDLKLSYAKEYFRTLGYEIEEID